MSETQPSDAEVVGVMIDGGIKLADYALEQWEGDKYRLGSETRDTNLARWRYIRKRIREIGREWKQTHS